MIHDENIDRLEKFIIGEIDFESIPIDEVDINNLSKCKICVYGNEGLIPHFHIIPINGLEICICIFEPLYFNHGSKQGRLTRKQRIQLNEWLKEKDKDFPDKTHWEMIKLEWKRSDNPLKNWKENSKQPNYTDMENMKG